MGAPQQSAGMARSSNQPALLAAAVTVCVNANAILPLVGKVEMLQVMQRLFLYDEFLNVTVLASTLSLILAPLLLQGRSIRVLLRFGFLALAALNTILAWTEFGWHVLWIRGLIGVIYGAIIPLGQFNLGQIPVSEEERVRLFSLNIVLIRLMLVALPFVGIGLMLLFRGAAVLFAALAVISAAAALLIPPGLPATARVQATPLAELPLPRPRRSLAWVDAVLIVMPQAFYAVLLVWLSRAAGSENRYLLLSLVFTIPYAAVGIFSLGLARRLAAPLSGLLGLWLPVLLCCVLLGGVTTVEGPATLLAVALVGWIGLPITFAPGQLISLWPTAGGRQVANLGVILLMTLPLSLGPSLSGVVLGLGEPSPTKALVLCLLSLPMLLWLQRAWQGRVVPTLRNPAGLG